MKKIISSLLCASVMMGAMAMPTFAEETGARVYVAPYGNDANNGVALTSAVATLDRAQEIAAKYVKAEKKVDIIIKGGVYELDETVALTQSGFSAEKPITYRAFDGEEVKFTKGKKVETPFTQTQGMSNVWQTTLDSDKFTNITGGLTDTLYVSGEIQTLSTYPNQVEPQMGFETVAITRNEDDFRINEEDGTLGNAFWTIPEEKQGDWKDNEGMFFGFNDSSYTYSNNHAMLNITATEFDVPTTKDATLLNVVVRNALSEVDSQGEYYIDPDDGILYYYSEVDPNTISDIYFATDNGASVFSINDVSNVSFENIDIICSNGNGFNIDGCQDVTIYNSSISGLGGKYAIYAQDATNLIITNCEIYDLKNDAIFVDGGDYYTLTDSGIEIRNCSIHDVGLESKAGSVIKIGNVKAVSEAYRLHAVGVKVYNNEIYNAPCAAINIEGNNHLIKNNKIRNAMLKHTDGGIIYAGRSWAERGTDILENYIYFTTDVLADASESADIIVGIYMDDLQSGMNIKDNVIYNVPRGLLFGSGNYNICEGNVVINANSALEYDRKPFRLNHIDERSVTNGTVLAVIRDVIAKGASDKWLEEYGAGWQYVLDFVEMYDEAYDDTAEGKENYGIEIQHQIYSPYYYAQTLEGSKKEVVNNLYTSTEYGMSGITVRDNKFIDSLTNPNLYFATDFDDYDKYDETTNPDGSYLEPLGYADTTASAIGASIANDEVTITSKDISTSDWGRKATDTYEPSDTENDYVVGESNQFKAIVAIYNGSNKLMSTQSQNEDFIYDGQEYSLEVDVPADAASDWYLNIFVWSADGLMRPLATKAPLLK